MGTRSVIAVRDGDILWKGRYCHWDGYPSGVGTALLQIVLRDGFTAAVKQLTQDRYGWSTLDARENSGPLKEGLDDGRFVKVPGYGTAYTTLQLQSSPSDWITSTSDDMGTEWAYVLEPLGITVYERRWSNGAHMTGMFGVGAGTTGYWELRGRVNFADARAKALMEKVA